jgi:hypothetical protein
MGRKRAKTIQRKTSRQNHQALAQERRNLGGRRAKESGHKIVHWMSISTSAERFHRATLWRLAGGRTYSPSSFGIGADPGHHEAPQAKQQRADGGAWVTVEQD